MSELFNTLYLWMFRYPLDTALVLMAVLVMILCSGWAWDEEYPHE